MDVNYAVCEYIERMAEAVPGMKAMLLDDETVRCESGPGKRTALLGARAFAACCAMLRLLWFAEDAPRMGRAG